jgi:hypothetical protein
VLTITPLISTSQTIWSEDFSTHANGVNSDAGRWSIDVSGAVISDAADWFEVNSNVFEGRDLDGPAIWETDAIDIAGCTGVQFSLLATESGTMESLDYFDVYYNIDGAGWTRVPNWNTKGDANHTLIDDFTSETVSVTGLSGSTIQIRVIMMNNAGTEYIRLDDVLIEGTCASVTPTQLSFTTYPTSCTETDATFTVVVCAQDATPTTDASYTSSITLSVGSGTGSLGGTLTQSAVNGCATFNNITLDAADNFTLDATDGTLNGTSGNISIMDDCGSCFEIRSVLADACTGTEGKNEMFRMQIGTSDLNTSNITIDWPNNSYLGICQDAGTASIISSLNATITGGGTLIEPTGGVLPANEQVIVITSEDFDWAGHDWSDLNYDVYVIFQCEGNTSGHFKNFCSSDCGERTLKVDFGASCVDSVKYEPHLLADHGDGDGMDYDDDGTPSYGNNGCTPPIFLLPIELDYFKGKVDKTKVELNWKTISELNVAYFEVEKSIDGVNFETLDHQLTNPQQTYQIIDHQPYVGINYYRLKEISIDDLISTYNIISVQYQPTTSNIKLINDQLIITAMGDVSTEISVFTPNGQILTTRHISINKGINTTNLSSENWAQTSGVYFLRVKMNNIIETYKFIIWKK